MGEPSAYSASELARWGLLDAARREWARDQLIAGEPLPAPAVFEVLLRQWAQAQGLSSQADVTSWLASRALGPDDLQPLVARAWRWQQWCERQGAGRLNSHFLARKAGLDQVRFWRLQCHDQDLAGELYQQLREGETCFVRLAEQAVDAPFQVERVGPLPLERLGGELAALLRVSEVGVVWAPRPDGCGSWQIVLLEQRLPAVLNDGLRRQLLDELGELALQQALKTTPGESQRSSRC